MSSTCTIFVYMEQSAYNIAVEPNQEINLTTLREFGFGFLRDIWDGKVQVEDDPNSMREFYRAISKETQEILVVRYCENTSRAHIYTTSFQFDDGFYTVPNKILFNGYLQNLAELQEVLKLLRQEEYQKPEVFVP